MDKPKAVYDFEKMGRLAIEVQWYSFEVLLNV